MAMMRRPRPKINTGPCPFDVAKTEPDYADPESLKHYVTDRGKIMAKNRTGVCQKHQRRLMRAIKRARHLALLNYAGQQIG